MDEALAAVNALKGSVRLASLSPGALSCLIVIPDHANIFSSEGWTKRKVKDFSALKSDGFS